MTAASVHPQLVPVLEALAANFPPFETLTPDAARLTMLQMVRARKAPPVAVASIEDRTFPGPAGAVPIRIYRPIEKRTDGAVIYYHGGGHVLGDLESHDAVVRSICAQSGTVFISVDYRLGPEHRFPAAVDDFIAAVNWVAKMAASLGVDATRLAVSGDSAGANLAAVAALAARDAGSPALKLQVLVYPITDYRLVDDSYRRYAKGYGILSAETMRWFQVNYLRTQDDALDWRASPIFAAAFANVAPAVLVTAECDVLRDEGVRYAEALTKAGVKVDHQEYAGMIHGFLPLIPAVDSAVAAQTHIAAAIVSALR